MIEIDVRDISNNPPRISRTIIDGDDILIIISEKFKENFSIGYRIKNIVLDKSIKNQEDFVIAIKEDINDTNWINENVMFFSRHNRQEYPLKEKFFTPITYYANLTLLKSNCLLQVNMFFMNKLSTLQNKYNENKSKIFLVKYKENGLIINEMSEVLKEVNSTTKRLQNLIYGHNELYEDIENELK